MISSGGLMIFPIRVVQEIITFSTQYITTVYPDFQSRIT